MEKKKTRVSNRGRPRRAIEPEARKQPLQLRSQQTVTVVLEAAAHILQTSGLSAYNTNAIAKRAGVSIGSIYQYFPNKDALTVALISDLERGLLEAVKRAISSSRGQSARDSLRTVIRTLLEMHYKQSQMNQILEREQERLGRKTSEYAMNELCEEVKRLLELHQWEFAISVDTKLVGDVFTVTHAMIDFMLLTETPIEEAENRVLRAVYGYLTLK